MDKPLVTSVAPPFRSNLAAFTDTLGLRAAPIVLWLSAIPWKSHEDRNDFIRALTGKDVRDV